MKSSNKYLILFLLFIFSVLNAKAQINDESVNPDYERPQILKIGQIIGNDTLYEFTLPLVNVYPDMQFKSKRDYRRFTRLYYNIKKVYPYAKMAGERLTLYAPILDSLETKSERDKYFKIIEDELWAEFGDDLKKLSFKQGLILIKLVDRECQRSTYQVLKDFRGGFSAFFYQAIARLWGYNLKQSYDPDGEDYEIEEIVKRIEVGQL